MEQVNAGAYVVHVPAERSEVELRLTSSTTSAGRAGTDVYIQVPAPVLQWTMVDGQQFGGKVGLAHHRGCSGQDLAGAIAAAAADRVDLAAGRNTGAGARSPRRGVHTIWRSADR